jgi:Cohesin domain
MNARRAFAAITLFFSLVAGFSACKKTPTSAAFEVDEPTILFVCNPASAPAGTQVRASLFIAANKEEIRVFGLDVTFDNRMLEFQGVQPGTLTAGWAAVDGNEIGTGSLRVGGFLGGGSAIPKASQGTLAEINFKVTGTGLANGQQSQGCAKQYTDDLATFRPETACFTFTLKN